MKRSVFLVLSAWIVIPLFWQNEPVSGSEDFPHMRIDVRLDLHASGIQGTARAILPPGRTIRILTGGGKPQSMTLDGEPLPVTPEALSFPVTAGATGGRLEIAFQREFPAGDPLGFINPAGAVLLKGWCPKVDGPATYELRATVPPDIVAVSEANSVQVEHRHGHTLYIFEFPHPRIEVSLVAGRYQLRQETCRGVEIAAYFSAENSAVAAGYLEKTRKYLDLYEPLLGPYPFRRFAVVENSVPWNQGSATLALLGHESPGPAFMKDAFLGREIVRSWFGNCVFPEPDGGDWSEGLASYLSDHRLAKGNHVGEDYRKAVLQNYQSYVRGEGTPALSEFRKATDPVTTAVGRGKGAMVFHMLSRATGEYGFYAALRSLVAQHRFGIVDWDGLQEVFAEKTGTDLSGFFAQWVYRKEIPVLRISQDGDADFEKGPRHLGLVIRQETETPFELSVPLVVETTSGTERHVVTVRSKREALDLVLQGEPLAAVLDPEYHLMRGLETAEFPPVLSRLLGAEHRYFTLPQGEEEVYGSFAVLLQSLGLVRKETGGLEETDLAGGSFLFLGETAPALAPPPRGMPERDVGAALDMMRNPLNPTEVFGRLTASSREELTVMEKQLAHWEQYSSLRFAGGRLIAKETAPARDGIPIELRADVQGMELVQRIGLDGIIDAVASRKVIYIGERHDRFSDHLAQLRVIQGLCERGNLVSVGMEMFQRPFQAVLNRYLAGDIDEKAFLKESEYFSRWGYDYQLYRPLLTYCREHGIPVVALNARAEVSRKVARGGLDSLSQEELEEIPKELDWSNVEYRRRLEEIFNQHPSGEVRGFDTFFQAQILWDETMALSIHEFLSEHPERQMVVLAGIGHVAYGHGIPARAKRLGGFGQAIMKCFDGGALDPAEADYMLFPREAPKPFSARMGVALEKTEDRIVIREVTPRSAAQKAGLRAGDIVLSFDGDPVKDVVDVKIALVFKKEGDKAAVEVKRIRRFAPDRTMEVTLGPFRSSGWDVHSPHGR